MIELTARQLQEFHAITITLVVDQSPTANFECLPLKFQKYFHLQLSSPTPFFQSLR